MGWTWGRLKDDLRVGVIGLVGTLFGLVVSWAWMRGIVHGYIRYIHVSWLLLCGGLG